MKGQIEREEKSEKWTTLRKGKDTTKNKMQRSSDELNSKAGHEFVKREVNCK